MTAGMMLGLNICVVMLLSYFRIGLSNQTKPRFILKEYRFSSKKIQELKIFNNLTKLFLV